jgi:hypothetical protein
MGGQAHLKVRMLVMLTTLGVASLKMRMVARSSVDRAASSLTATASRCGRRRRDNRGNSQWHVGCLQLVDGVQWRWDAAGQVWVALHGGSHRYGNHIVSCCCCCCYLCLDC